MRTALFKEHKALGAKIVDFEGWEMPLHYAGGILHEHEVVRNRAGLFDVSHMGRLTLSGADAARCVEELCTNTIAEKKAGSATYTVLAREDGTSVDDLIVYKESDESFFLVVNAGNRAKDLAHIKAFARGYDTQIRDHYSGEGILALQGPRALELLQEIFPEAAAIAPFHFAPASYEGAPCLLSHTGYTGAGGMEIYGSDPLIAELWKKLLAAGAEPVGLGARDTLRLEMGYALYGHELTDAIAPTESVSSWTVKLTKPRFLGKEALLKLDQSGKKRSQYGIIVDGKGIARSGSKLYRSGSEIGIVTSGSYSPTLKKAIAIVMVSGTLAPGEALTVEIRGNAEPAHVVSLPFLTSRNQQ